MSHARAGEPHGQHHLLGVGQGEGCDEMLSKKSNCSLPNSQKSNNTLKDILFKYLRHAFEEALRLPAYHHHHHVHDDDDDDHHHHHHHAGEEALRLLAHSPCLRRVGEQDGNQVEGGEHHQVNFSRNIFFAKNLNILVVDTTVTFIFQNIFDIFICRVVSKESCCPGYKRKGQGRGREKVLVILSLFVIHLVSSNHCHIATLSHCHTKGKVRGEERRRCLSWSFCHFLSLFCHPPFHNFTIASNLICNIFIINITASSIPVGIIIIINNHHYYE